MHAMQYRIKRSYWSSVKTFNALLEEFSLTCARFDLLTLVGLQNGRLQSLLWKALGCSRSVVCRILQKLEKLGWIRRWRPPEDKRQRWVQLTALGREVFGAAASDVPLAQTVEVIWDSTIDPLCFLMRRWRMHVFSQLEEWLDNIRYGFRDRAFVPYEWADEEDLDPEDDGLDEDPVALLRAPSAGAEAGA